LIDAFLAAWREGDFQRLLALLSPEVVLRADDQTVRIDAASQGQQPALCVVGVRHEANDGHRDAAERRPEKISARGVDSTPRNPVCTTAIAAIALRKL
jgi:hypothetical protein